MNSLLQSNIDNTFGFNLQSNSVCMAVILVLLIEIVTNNICSGDYNLL